MTRLTLNVNCLTINMSQPPAKRKQTELTLETKIYLIRESGSLPKPTNKFLSEKYGIGKLTLADILKKKDVYKAESEQNSDTARHEDIIN